MFAYCLNNPINFLDCSGNSSIWFYLREMLQMAFIHMRVQLEILETHSEAQCELWLNNGEYFVGRADVMVGNSVWEIKHATVDPVTEAERILIASAQAASYIGLTAVRTGREVESLGSAGYFKGSFTITVVNGVYLVEYDTPAPGVILYRVSKTTTPKKSNYLLLYEKKSTKETVVKIAGSFAIGFAMGFATGGFDEECFKNDTSGAVYPAG